jgi:MFS transporter, PPP family, 3-phenylpropionic acid transporter
VNQLRSSLSPGWRGAIYYACFWGTIGLFEAFVTVHFLRLNFSSAQIGWLAAVFPLFNFLVAPSISRLADRKARRVQFLTVALLLYGLLLMLMALPTTFLAVLPIFAMMMAARAPIVPLADSLIARMAERYELDYGRMRLWGSILFTITSSLLGALWQKTGFQTMFVVAGLAFSVVAAAAMLLEEAGKPDPALQAAADQAAAASQPATAGKRRFVLPETSIMFLLAANFLTVGALFMTMTFAIVYLNQIGGTASQVGAMFGISALGEVPGMLYGRRLARRLGNTTTLLLALGLVSLGFIGYAFSTTPLMMLLLSPIRGLGFGMFLVGTVTIINQRAPEGMYATYQGLLNSLCWGLAPLIGGPLAGLLYESTGPSNLFLINAAMTVMAGLLLLPTYRLWRTASQPAVHQAIQGN